jgi:predicted RNA methylase
MADFTPYEGDFIPLDGGATPAPSNSSAPAFKPYTGDFVPLEASAPAATQPQAPPQATPFVTLQKGVGHNAQAPSTGPGILEAGAVGAKEGLAGAFGDWGQTIKALYAPPKALPQGVPTLKPGTDTDAPSQDAYTALREPLSLKPGMPNLPKIAYQTTEGLTHSLPAMGGFFAGAAAGTAAVGGPEDPLALPTATIGGVSAAAVVSGLQSVGPFLAQELKKDPTDVDGAISRAAKRAATDGVLTGASFALFELRPFRGAIKNLLFQALGVQPAAGIAGEEAKARLFENRDITPQEAEQAGLQSAIGTLVPAAAHHGAAALIGHEGASPTAEPPAPDQVRQAVTAAGQDPSHFDNLTTEPANDGGHFVVGTVGDQRFVVAKIPPESAAPAAAPALEPAGQTAEGALVRPVPPMAEQAPPLDTPAARLQQIRPEAPPPLEETHPNSIVPVSESAASEALPKVAQDLANATAEGDTGRAEVLRQEQEVIGRTAEPPETADNRLQPPITTRAPRPKAEPKELSLNEFLADRGGMRDVTGELTANDLHLWHQGRRYPRGQIMGKLVRDDGEHPDYAREAAVEAHYLPEGSQTGDLYNAMSEDAAGRRVYPHGVQPEAAEPDPVAEEHDRQRWAEKTRAELQSLGVPDVASIPESALAQRLQQSLDAVGADDVHGAIDAMEAESAAADARLHGDPEVAAALESDKGAEDFQPPFEPAAETPPVKATKAKLVPSRTPEGGVQWTPLPIEEQAHVQPIGTEGEGNQAALHAAPPAGEGPLVHEAPGPDSSPPRNPAPDQAEQGDTGPEAVKARASIKLAEAVADFLKTHSGTKINAKQLQEWAEHVFGGKLASGHFDRKDMFDALELGVNKYIETSGKFEMVDDPAGAAATVARLRELVMRLPTQTVRSEEQTRFQQFSTPPDYAYAVAWAAKIGGEDRVLEPNAGTGSLVAAASLSHPAQIIVNELSPRRAELLKGAILQGAPTRVFTEDAAQLHNILPDDVKPSVVVMNPPFSQTGGRMGDMKDVMVGANHIAQAFARLEPGGRLVAIVGQGMGPEAPRFVKWFKDMGAKGAWRANVLVSGKVYGKYGTTFGTRVLVIDKVPPDAQPMVRGSAETVPDLIGRLQEVRGSRVSVPEGQSAGQPRPAEPSSPAGAPAGEGAPIGSGRVPPVGPGVVGPGEGGRGGARSGPGSAESLPGGRSGPNAGVGSEPVAPVASEQPGGGGRPGGTEANAPERTPVGSEPAGAEPSGVGGDRGPSAITESDVSAGAERPVAAINVKGNAPETAEALDAADIGAVYEPYRPQKLSIPGAKDHPGKLVQSAAMASVEPPDPVYQPRIPQELIDSGALSVAQLEPIVYAGQAHSKMLPAVEGEAPVRRGFMDGDGTGVGKGRIISGVILDNWNQGRKKAVWVSEKGRLLRDAKRDWSGLGQDENQVMLHNKTKLDAEIKADQGILFTTYDTLKMGASDQAKLAQGLFVKGQAVTHHDPLSGAREGIIQATANAKDKRNPTVKVKFGDGSAAEVPVKEVERRGAHTAQSRVDQIVKWLGPNYDGVIAFDESHNMGNAVQSKGNRGTKEAAQKALAGLELKKRMPNARVMYFSATGATEVSNLSYANRLGLWGRGTPFSTSADFVNKISEGGIAAMELIARDMKALGSYIARGLSYEGVEQSRLEHTLEPHQRENYDELAGMWQTVLANVDKALETTGGDKNSQAKSAAKSAFWGSHQRFFNQIITSMQMPSVIRAAEEDIKAGRQVVFQLVNTNEAATTRAAAKAESPEDIEDLDITPRQQLDEYLKNTFPTQQHEEYVDDQGNVRSRPVEDSEGRPVENKEAVAAREALRAKLGSISVPDGPLDMIINHFGHENVAEVTGRKRRWIQKFDPAKNITHRMEDMRGANANENETNAFQGGQKKILAFSAAGGTGASYHADNTTASRGARRAHYLVQAGWRADGAIQGFGRTHRTNQASAPIFRLVTTDVPGQKRFISSIARRLAQLGALTKGERKTTDQGVFSARDNLESKEAREALANFYTDLMSHRIEGMTPQEFEQQSGLKLDKGGGSMPDITQFLNRLLSFKLDAQRIVFDAFDRQLQDTIDRHAAAGTLDVGTETVKADRAVKASEQVVHTDPESGAQTKYVRVELHNKIIPKQFEDVEKMSPQFYVESKRGHIYAVTNAGSTTNTTTGRVASSYRLTSPTDYHYVDQDKIDGYRAVDNWTKIERSDKSAELKWAAAVAKAPTERTSNLHLITGAVLPIWDRLSGSSRPRTGLPLR